MGQGTQSSGVYYESYYNFGRYYDYYCRCVRDLP
jgi:hypothetical protein